MSGLTPADVCTEKWDLSKWWTLWSQEGYLDWRARWIDSMDKSEPNRLACEAAIAEECARPYWERLLSINFHAKCDLQDGIDAWEAMIDMVTRKGWTVVDREEMFPQFAGALRVMMGSNAHCWAKVRRNKTRDEMTAPI